MKKETYTIAVMPASGRRIRTFSISAHSLVSILVSLAIVTTSTLIAGSLLTWRYCRQQKQIACDAVQEFEAMQTEFGKQLQEIRKSYSDFRVILGIEEEELDDKAGKGGPQMPELPDSSDFEPSLDLENTDDELPARMSSLLKDADSLKSDLHDLTDVMDGRMSELATTPSIWPVIYESREGLWISSGFGQRKDPFTGRWTIHTGADIPAPRGTPLVSTADGFITEMGKDSYLGNYIEIHHSDRFSTFYGHMDYFAKGVKEGKRVKRGDIIGYAGRTGRATGSHVHYEVRLRGERVDPRDYILN